MLFKKSVKKCCGDMSPSQELASIQGTASKKKSASLVSSSGHVTIYCKKILTLYLAMYVRS